MENALASHTNGGSVNRGAGVVTIGGLMLSGSAIVQALSHRHIGKAGELRKQSALSQNLKLQGSSEGFGHGLAYKY